MQSNTTGNTLVILFEAPLTVLKIEPSPLVLYYGCRNEMSSLSFLGLNFYPGEQSP